MAIARVNKLGAATGGSAISSVTLTVAATTTAHNKIIVASFWGSSFHISAVTDSQGNNYAQDATITAPSGGGWGAVFSARADNVLTSGVDTITITWTGGTVNDGILAAYEYSGLANFSPVDLTQVGTGSSSSPTSGNLVTNFANELIFGVIGWSTVGAMTAHSYTELDNVAGSTHSMETQEDIVSATGTFAVTGTLASAGSPSWVSLAVGYSDTANGAKPSNTTTPVITGSGVLGMQLTCSQGAWSNTPTAYSYQWKRDGTNVSTGAHYLVTTADVGHVLSCVVSASNKYGSTTSTASNTVTPTVNAVRAGLGI